MEELKELSGGQDLGESGYTMADAPRPSKAKVEVKGAGETRLNGTYNVQFATKDRIEFTKQDDEQCQIFWSCWKDEWVMLIGDYKMGSTLYRNNYRPNWKADVCHGCPEDNWQKWFGKDGSPSIRLIPEGAEGVEVGEKGKAAELAGDNVTDVDAEAAAKPPSPSRAPLCISWLTLTSPLGLA